MELNDGQSIDPHGGDSDETPAVAGIPKPEGTESKPDFRATEDGNQVEYGGHKYIREEALHSERTRAQNLERTLGQMAPLMPEFEQFLQSRQQSDRATVGRATRGAQSDYTEDELTGYAITRGYYDKDNKPDLKRAGDDLDIMTAIADRRAGRAVQPLANMSERDRALRNTAAEFSRIVDGEPVADEKYLRAVFDAVPDHIKADPAQAQYLSVIAAGLQALDERKQGRQGGGRSRREPVFREGGGGRRDYSGGDELDALDRAAARARGKTPDQWSKMSRSIGGDRGMGTVLEEV